MQNHASNTLHSQHTKDLFSVRDSMGLGLALIPELRFALKQKPLNSKDSLRSGFSSDAFDPSPPESETTALQPEIPKLNF